MTNIFADDIILANNERLASASALALALALGYAYAYALLLNITSWYTVYTVVHRIM